MAHDRKAGESASSLANQAQGQNASAKGRVVPASKKDDIEDVAWALQTAEATWSRGDHADALKWIRRAAEAASEAEMDDRALELAKAAADVASLIADHPIGERQTAVAPAPVITPAAPQVATRIGTVSQPPQAMTPAAGRAPIPAPFAGPTPSKVPANMPALPRPGQKGPIPSRVQAAPVSKRSGGRRSSPSFTDEATAPGDAARPRRASTTNETKKRARHSRPPPPAPDDTAHMGPVTARHPSITDDLEAWPTQSLVGDDLDDEKEHTRIGTPAYRETAQKASARPPAIPTPAPLVMSQAVRVVVWRAADGVHVAPAGTQVAAIGVEAILVALDPVADLAAWLSNK